MKNRDQEVLEIDEYVDTTESAIIYGVSPRTMEAWRQKGIGPEYVKFGRAIRYGKSKLRKNAEENTHNKKGGL